MEWTQQLLLGLVVAVIIAADVRKQVGTASERIDILLGAWSTIAMVWLIGEGTWQLLQLRAEGPTCGLELPRRTWRLLLRDQSRYLKRQIVGSSCALIWVMSFVIRDVSPMLPASLSAILMAAYCLTRQGRDTRKRTLGIPPLVRDMPPDSSMSAYEAGWRFLVSARGRRGAAPAVWFSLVAFAVIIFAGIVVADPIEAGAESIEQARRDVGGAWNLAIGALNGVDPGSDDRPSEPDRGDGTERVDEDEEANATTPPTADVGQRTAPIPSPSGLGPWQCSADEAYALFEEWRLPQEFFEPTLTALVEWGDLLGCPTNVSRTGSFWLVYAPSEHGDGGVLVHGALDHREPMVAVPLSSDVFSLVERELDSSSGDSRLARVYDRFEFGTGLSWVLRYTDGTCRQADRLFGPETGLDLIVSPPAVFGLMHQHSDSSGGWPVVVDVEADGPIREFNVVVLRVEETGAIEGTRLAIRYDTATGFATSGTRVLDSKTPCEIDVEASASTAADLDAASHGR